MRTSHLSILILFHLACVSVSAQTRVPNPITQLQEKLNRGTNLTFNPDRGYLDSLLKALSIYPSSQVLVFSKTSLQEEAISPRNPRAIYFNDTSYVAFLRNGFPLEIAVADPSGRMLFYTLKQAVDPRQQFKGDTTCNLCHDPTRTGVPLLIMRSHFTDVNGHAFQAPEQMSQLLFRITDQTPFAQRWGGWYVTGTHGKQLHMGNMFAPIEVERIGSNPVAYASRMDRTRGANKTTLDEFFDTKPFLSGSSDIVALMVLAHQIQVQNLINSAVSEARTLNSGKPTPEFQSAADSLLRALFMVGAVPFTEPVRGTTSFADDFVKRGPKNRQGRSLRELDLEHRLFRYPLSYMIYSDSITNAPPVLRTYLFKRISEVLRGIDRSQEFSGLSENDRTAVFEILLDTQPEIVESRTN